MDKETNKLFLVKLKGFFDSQYGSSYVVARTCDEAYDKVRSHLDRLDYGFDKDRELDKIELLAEETNYPDCNTRLFLFKIN